MPPEIPDKLPCESAQQLEQELSTLRDVLSLEETEETWDRIARALTRFSAVIKGGGYKYEKELVSGIKASTRPIVSAMNSERTRLSAAALDCLIIIAPRVGLAFEVLVPLFVPHILRLATRTNKVYVTRSQAGLALILGYCHIPSIIPHLLAACKESKIVTGRAVAVEGVLRCLNKWDWTEREIKARVGDVEEVIKITGRDKDAGIRQTSRKVFEAYKTLFPDRVDEFTGPLTPVMRKYLDIKPQHLTSKGIERARPPLAQDKQKRPPIKPDFTSSTSAASSAASKARTVLGTHETNARGASSKTVATSGFMPPPPLIPSQARPTSRTQAQRTRSDHNQPEEYTNQERQRVLSTASSTFSIKSAPSNLHTGYNHQPPVRLAASQSHAAAANSTQMASSGPARRVRRVVAVEPHPANRPDFSTVAHKPPVRPTPLPGKSLPQMQKPTGGPGREPVGLIHDAPASATGIMFPTSETESAPTAVEHRGAQRVPKVKPPRVSSPTAGRPETAVSDTVKREAKPSIFRRGAPGAFGAGDKKNERSKEAFAPRRGGGVTQPTLSQLSKQRALPSASVAALPVRGRMANPSVASKRPVWGAGAKPTTTKGLPGSRVVSRNGAAKVPAATKGDEANVTEVQPVMVPLPTSPGEEKDVLPPVVSSGSPEAPRVDEEQTHGATTEELTTEDASNAAQGLTGSEPNSDEIRDDKAPEVVQDPSDGGSQDAFATETNPPPRTLWCPSAEEDSEEDEPDAEFTTGDVYDSAGPPVKTPGKIVSVAAAVLPERNPLAEVVLNE